jgi:glycosyltransferase involved in cell wall biosynthesis
MTILYLADTRSTHDVKWVEKLAELGGRAVWLPRKVQQHTEHKTNHESIIGYIEDFSVVRIWRTILSARKIKGIIKKHDVKLIHIMYADPNALWCNFRVYFDVPMLVTCRGTDVLKGIPKAFERNNILNRVVAWLYKRAFEKVDFVTGTSLRQIESVRRFPGRTNDLAVIRTGVDIERLKSDTSEHFPLSDNMPFILFPRYIRPIYNHEFCLEAIGLLPKEFTNGFKMVFVGKNGGDMMYQRRIETLMAQLPHIRFDFLPKQPQEALFELYKRASVVVMTPLSDGSPVSAMEAMLCGKPVILGPLEYDKDLFEGKVWQLQSWSPSELASLIQKALTVRLPDLKKEDIELMDLHWNMNKVMKIYNDLIKAKMDGI